MLDEEYQAAVRACALVASMLTQYDLPDLLQRIERADAFGPILDPTLWRDKQEAMDEDRKLLEAALPLWAMGKRLADTSAE
jgi:hypothetical protein